MQSCEEPPCIFASMEDGPPVADLPWTGQWAEDEWIYNRLFHNKRGGLYVEMGAMDGVKLSNTLWLHQAAGWRGLLIEACPKQYANLSQNRQGDVCVHAAVCDKFQEVHWLSNNELGGIMELMAEGLAPAEFQPGGARHHELAALPCVPMQFIFDRLGITHVDLWSLDVEGAELAVLETVDFSRMTINAMVVETDGINATKDGQVVELLTNAGFVAAERGPNRARWTRNGQNTFFVHKDYLPRRTHAPGAEELYVET